MVLAEHGQEFMGDYYTLLAQHEITHRLASMEHSQSDGLADRMVQTMKRWRPVLGWGVGPMPLSTNLNTSVR